MFLKILAHPVFTSLNFHMPMIVDLSHPVVMLTGENGSGKSTLLHSIYYALARPESGRLRVPARPAATCRSARSSFSTPSSTIRERSWIYSKTIPR